MEASDNEDNGSAVNESEERETMPELRARHNRELRVTCCCSFALHDGVMTMR